MNNLFYKDWYQNRVQKIINIFGKDWFAGKNILELGACYGDIGFELLKLGADVTFADARQEHLDVIESKFTSYSLIPELIKLNQEEKYNLNKKYDLVLHLGVLYHIENWKQDLECAMNHSDLMILETVVSHVKFPDRQIKNYGKERTNKHNEKYEGINSVLNLNCQESIESQIIKNNGKFIRFDNQELNTTVSYDIKKGLIRHLYDWDYDSSIGTNSQKKNQKNISTHFRRFWLVIK